MIRVILGLALLLILYETIARDVITGLTVIALLSMLLLNEPRIAAEFESIVKGN